MAEGDDTSAKDIEREKEPRQPLIFGDFSLPPLGPDAPEGLEPLMRQYLEQAAQNENVGQQMVAWAKRQNTPAPPQEPPPRVTPADGGKLAALQTAAQHIQGRNYTGSPTRTAPTFHGQRIPPSAAPGMFHPTPVDRALNPYFNPYGNTWRDPQQPPPAANYFGGQRGEFDPFRRAASHMSVDAPTPPPPPPDPRLAQVEARLEELTRMMNAANLHSHPPPPPRGRDDSMQPMQTETPQDMELQRKERERFERAIHQAYKATPAFCPDEEDYSDWIEQTWIKWSTCGLDMELYEVDRSKDQALKKLLYNCLTIKPPGEKSCPNLTFLIGMNPVLDLAGDSFPQYYKKLMVQFASPDRQLQAAAEFDLRKQERTEEPAVYAADKLKLWWKSNPNAGANNTRAFLHAAINGLLNKEVRRRLFELGPSITLSNWVTTVQSVSMTVWTLFYENVGPEGVSGSGLSVGRKNVLSLKKQVVMAVNEAVPPEEGDAFDLDNAEGLAGVGEMIEEENEVYAVNQSGRSRGRCFDCGSLTHFQNSPKCQEKGARKFHPASTPNSNLKKLTYQTPGDNKSANQVIYRKKNNFSSVKTKGKPNPGRANYTNTNKKRIRYVQVIEEGEDTDQGDDSAADSEGEGEDTVANISEPPSCYGWSPADEALLGQSIFGVMTPIPATHTTQAEENKENEYGEIVPRGLIQDSRSHPADPTTNSALLCPSTNQLLRKDTSVEVSKSGKMPEKEKGKPCVSDDTIPGLLPLANPGPSAVRAMPKLREIRPKPAPATYVPDPAAAAAATTADAAITADAEIAGINLPPSPTLEVAGNPVPASDGLNPVPAGTPADDPLAVDTTAVDPVERPAEGLSMEERTASVSRLRAWQASLNGERPVYDPKVPPPGPGMPLPLGRDPFRVNHKVTPAAPPPATFVNPGPRMAVPTHLQMYHRRQRQGPLTRAEVSAIQAAPEVPHRPHPFKQGRGRGRGRGTKPERPPPPCPHCLPCGACVVCKAVPPPNVDGDIPFPLTQLPPVEGVLVRTKAALRCALYNHVQQGPITDRRPFDNGVDLDRCLARLIMARIEQLEKFSGVTPTNRPVAVVPPLPTGDVEMAGPAGGVTVHTEDTPANPPNAATVDDPEPAFEALSPPETDLLFDAIVGINEAGFKGRPGELFNLVTSLLDDAIVTSAFNHVPREVLTAAHQRLKSHYVYMLLEKEQQCHLQVQKARKQWYEGETALNQLRTRHQRQSEAMKDLQKKYRHEKNKLTLVEREISTLRGQLEDEQKRNSTGEELVLKKMLVANEAKLKEAQAMRAAATASEKRQGRDRKLAEKELLKHKSLLQVEEKNSSFIRHQLNAVKLELEALKAQVRRGGQIIGGEIIGQDEVQIIEHQKPAPPLIQLRDEEDQSTQTDDESVEDIALYAAHTADPNRRHLEEKMASFARDNPLTAEDVRERPLMARLGRAAHFLQVLAAESLQEDHPAAAPPTFLRPEGALANYDDLDSLEATAQMQNDITCNVMDFEYIHDLKPELEVSFHQEMCEGEAVTGEAVAAGEADPAGGPPPCQTAETAAEGRGPAGEAPPFQ